MNSAVKLETAISGIASKAGLGADQLARLRADLRAASTETNQFTSSLAGGIDYLVGMGMSVTDANAAIKSIGIASTATGSDVEQMSAAGFAAISNLRVPAAEVMTALDAMAMAGKRGGFELKDMAQYFPTVGSAYAGLGQSGLGAVADLSAAMQVMRKNTGDASSAATNLQNVIQKMQSPATVRAFKKMGVNLDKEMKKAAEQGLTPLEAIAEVTNKALKGDLSKIGYLFEDSQAQAGVRSLIQNMEEYRRIREEAMGAGGTNQADFDRVMDTTAEKAKAAGIAFDNLKESIGASLLPVIRQLSEVLVPVLEAFGRFTEANPGLVAALASTAAGFIALKASIAGLSFLGLMGKGGALSMLSFAVNGLGGALGRVGRNMGEMTRLQRTLAEMNGQKFTGFDAVVSAAKGLALAAPGAGTFVSALSGLGSLLAAVSAPVWGTFALAAAAIGAAGYLVWRYWDRISAVFSGVGEAIGDLLAPALEKARPLLDWLKPIGEQIASGWERAKSAMSSVSSWLGSFFQQETLTDEDKEKARQAGYDFIMSLWNGMKQLASELVAWVSDLGSQLVAPFTNLGSRIKGAFGGGGDAAAAPSGPIMAPIHGSQTNSIKGNAKGGPISRGSTYMVGEEGPELITAGRSGYVNKAGSFGGGGGVTVNQSLSFNISGNATEDVIEKIRRVMRDEVRETFRGVFADTGMRMA